MAKALLTSMGIHLLSKLGKMSTFILSLFLEVNSLHGQIGFLCHFSAKKSTYRENDSFSYFEWHIGHITLALA